ncbi:zona pellucida sperm-binding protein 3-like [Mastacembelus armatus]|uniref:zona pellucida sperm-binding protein 3-like n=1 Tax=Mastacembelus armatus TaxID=205130 RepID=UPI000E4647E6|nr:zona pellucida sperm-binding protein 3-like [Mastacembelus armatus]
MVTLVYLSVIILAWFATAANADIQVVCANKSVSITWEISADLVPYAARLFLGSCMPSHLNLLPSGKGEVQFNYGFENCKFKKQIKGKQMSYQNEITFRPYPKSKPAAFVYPIKCVYRSPANLNNQFLNPGSVSEGRGSLVFHMALLNEQLTGLATTNVIPLGSFMPIWAQVEQKSHQPLLLLMEECVAAHTPQLHSGSWVYPIINNKGCLLESKQGNSIFLPRYHSSALILYLQSFRLGHEGEVYIHCKLTAWDPDVLDESNKVCHYVKETERWSLLDDPFQSSICNCCDSTCKSRSKRQAEQESRGLRHNFVLGPLIVVEPDSPAK